MCGNLKCSVFLTQVLRSGQRLKPWRCRCGWIGSRTKASVKRPEAKKVLVEVS